MHIRWTFFKNIRDTRPQPYQTSWAKFSSSFSQHKVVSHKESAPLFSMNVYKEGGSRGNESIDFMSGAVLDFDGKHAHAKTLNEVLPCFESYAWLAYTTFSHTPENPRFRIVLPFEKSVSPQLYREYIFPAIKAYLQRMLKCDDLKELDNASEKPSQIFYVPCAKDLSQAVFAKNDAPFMEPHFFMTREQAHKALSLLPDETVNDYHQWIKVGMCLYSELGQDGLPLWDSWSSKGKEYKGIKDCADKWKTFKKNGVGIGTLFYMAGHSPDIMMSSASSAKEQKQTAEQSNPAPLLADQILAFLKRQGKALFPREIAFGIQKETENEQASVRNTLKRLYERGKISKHSNGSYGDCDIFRISVVANLSGFRGDTEAQKADTEAQKSPRITHLSDTAAYLSDTAESKLWSNFRQFDKFDLFNLSHTPLLQSIHDFFTSNCKPLLPHLALGATINVAGHLMRSVGVCGGKRTNFFTLLVTRTGGGKDSIAKNIHKLMECQGWDMHMASNFVSVQAYERVLKAQNGTLFMVTDEAANWFGSFGGKNTSEHYKKLKTALKLSYSGENYVSQNAKGEESLTIPKPFVSCSFLGTPVIFQNIKEDDITDGLLGRMLVFYDVNDHWGIDSSILRQGLAFIKPALPAIKVPNKPHELYHKNDDCSMFYDALLNL
jgi:hypothetical protein